jgi:hypothetical protein
MGSMGHFNILAFIVSGIVYFLIGWLWYSNALFAKPWAKETGVQMGGKQSTPPVLPMLGQLVSSFLYALGVYMVIMLGQFTDVKGALIAAVSVIGFFIAPINSGNLFFKNKAALFFIEAGYQSVGAVVLAIIFALWK